MQLDDKAILAAVSEVLAVERAARIALQTKVDELSAGHDAVMLTPGPPGERGEKGLAGDPGERGEPGASITVDDVAPLIASAVERAFAAVNIPPAADVAEDVAPADVAESVALAVRMIAEFPRAEAAGASVINVHSNVTLPEAKPHQVNVTMPEQAAPVVHVAPPHVVIEAKPRAKEVTKVTGYDKSGRITSFEKTEV